MQRKSGSIFVVVVALPVKRRGRRRRMRGEKEQFKLSANKTSSRDEALLFNSIFS
jgi:hypothetical protein